MAGAAFGEALIPLFVAGAAFGQLLMWVGVSNVLFLWVSVAGFNFIPIHLVLLQIRSLIPTIGPPLNPFHPSINLHLQRFHGIYSGYNTFLNHPVGNG